MSASFGLSTGFPLTSFDWSHLKVFRHIATRETRTATQSQTQCNGGEDSVPRVMEIRERTLAGTEDWGFS